MNLKCKKVLQNKFATIMPGVKRKGDTQDGSIAKKITQGILPHIPKNETYAASFQHNKPVTHVLVSDPTDFIVSLSADGVIKFWKRRPKTIEFVKSYRAHLSAVKSAALSPDGLFVATCDEADKSVKVFNVLDFDMLCKHDLSFHPLAVFFISVTGASDSYLAVSDQNSRDLWIFPATNPKGKQVKFSRHAAPVNLLRSYGPQKIVISTDLKGGLEFWHPDVQSDFPTARASTTDGFLLFEYKTESDLYALQKAGTHALSFTVSPRGQYFAMWCQDGHVRVFKTRSGTLCKVIDETLEAQKRIHEAPETPATFKFSTLEFQRRCATEEEFVQSSAVYKSNLVFDPSESFLIYPSMLGMKVVRLADHRVVAIVGKRELGFRYTAFDISFGSSKLVGVHSMPSGGASQKDEGSPETLLVAAAYKRNQLIVFNQSSNTQDETRDIKYDAEDPSATDGGTKKLPGQASKSEVADDGLIRAGNYAVIHTTYGDVKIKLFPQLCPRTVENFCVHAQRGYFDGIIFHRVIRNFMIQTGDPLGNGTGGESIWGSEFADEFTPELSHDAPGMVSMANAGPNTNGSQFFITTVPTPFLNGKHTVFGKVEKGLDVVKDIESVKTNVQDRPLKDIRIVGMKILL